MCSRSGLWLNTLVSAAVRPGRGVVGGIEVSAPVAFGLARVAPLVPALLDKHPYLHVDLRLEDRAVDLLADGVDVAIRAGVHPPDTASLIARRLGRARAATVRRTRASYRHDQSKLAPGMIAAQPAVLWFSMHTL